MAVSAIVQPKQPLEKAMSLADDLNKLEQMHERGTLSADEFQRAKSKLLTKPQLQEPALQSLNGFRRSASDRWLGGVCGGVAQMTGLDSWIWRLTFTLLFLAGGFGFVLYLILWFFVPLEEVTTYIGHEAR
jgi:phage shock protein PspC (stress-responsive transcriptional regulator)